MLIGVNELDTQSQVSVYIIYGPVFFYKLRNPPTFKTEEFCLVSNVQLVKRLLPCNEQQIQHYLALLWK